MADRDDYAEVNFFLPDKKNNGVNFFLPDNGREPNNGHGGRLIRFRPDDDPAECVRNLLTAGFSIPTEMSWNEFQRTVLPGVRRFWEDATHHREPLPGDHASSDRTVCYELIYRAIARWMAPYDVWGPELPLWKGKPITYTRLAKLMDLVNDRPDPDDRHEGIYRKYAKLWLLHRRLFLTKPTFSQGELKFLKRHDRGTYTAATQLLRQPDRGRHVPSYTTIIYPETPGSPRS
jgi:hypothetical protein